MAIETRFIDITPELASLYIQKNIPNNRRIDANRVASYALAMKSGDWKCTHQGIGFDTDGNLIDGQHRLSAIIRSGVTVRMAVTTGIEKNALYNIDTAKSRTINDLMQINDEESYVKQMSRAAAALLRIYGAHPITINAERLKTFIVANEAYFKKLAEILSTYTKAMPSIVQVALFTALVNNVPYEELHKFHMLWVKNETNGCELRNIKCVLNYREKIRGKAVRTLDGLKEAQSVIHCFVANTVKPTVRVWYPIHDIMVWTMPITHDGD